MNTRPKRILALDGGGIRGTLSLGVLARVEAEYREREARDDLVLADVFDLFAGTSTGAIIAACLAWGMPVADVLTLYRQHGRAMFRPSRPWQLLRAKYQSGAIADMFKDIFVEVDGTPALLGSARMKAILLVVMRNATTGSPWPLTNNPHAVFNDRSFDGCNLDIPIWQLLRASTAAPTFFPPESIKLGGIDFVFMDGGITPHNNPALIALLTATVHEYRLNWTPGIDNLYMLSVGTGHARSTLASKPVDRLNLIDHMRYLPPALIGSFGEHQDLLCRILGRCIHGDKLDAEVGDLRGEGPIPNPAKLCTYARINPPLPDAIPLDDITRIDELADIGAEHAKTLDLPLILR